MKAIKSIKYLSGQAEFFSVGQIRCRTCKYHSSVHFQKNQWAT